MAINPFVLHPAQFGIPTVDYPYGVPRDVSSPSAGDGSPWNQSTYRDLRGFHEAMLDQAPGGPIVPTGNAETAVASQYLDALRLYFVGSGQLFNLQDTPFPFPPDGRIIPIVGNRFPRNFREGLIRAWQSGTNVILDDGGCRSRFNEADIETTDQKEKDFTTIWTTGIGGHAEGMASPAADTWYRHFIARTPAGDVDTHFIDDNPTASNFFFETNSTAAGFTDENLYRRIGWIGFDNAGVITEFNQSEDDYEINRWKNLVAAYSNAGGQATGPRALLDFSPGAQAGVLVPTLPPDCYLMGSYSAKNETGTDNFSIITEVGDADEAPTVDKHTQWRAREDNQASSVFGEWRVDSNTQLGHRANLGDPTVKIVCRGYRDSGIIP